ncbi:MAG: hypothetical protein KME26_03185 [Oscillatoria princeps RMCB-10]|jgi:hypothetical protein|nr:hypothetical protein [Oscillatoria princeps RMCB-10]
MPQGGFYPPAAGVKWTGPNCKRISPDCRQLYSYRTNKGEPQVGDKT